VVLEVCWFEKLTIPKNCILYRNIFLVFEYILKKFFAQVRKDSSSPDIKGLISGKKVERNLSHEKDKGNNNIISLNVGK